CHLTIKRGFHLKHQTICHQHLNMTKTLKKPRQAIDDNSLHSFTPGQNADTVVPEKISVAMDIMQKKKETKTEDTGEDGDIEADNLMDDLL
ncbi:hypothetical protein L208DRAFT_1316435, partial [Tricholoma matsutake]